jgi:hypothetical protein
VNRRIEAHSSRTPWSLYSLDDLEFARRSLAGYGKGAVAATGKGIPVEPRGIDASTNRQRGNHFAIVRVHDDQLLRLPTPNEQTVSRRIHRHADR